MRQLHSRAAVVRDIEMLRAPVLPAPGVFLHFLKADNVLPAESGQDLLQLQPECLFFSRHCFFLHFDVIFLVTYSAKKEAR